MAAHEHHPQLVVFDRPWFQIRSLRQARQLDDDGVGPRLERRMPAQNVERAVAGHAKEPPTGIGRDAGVRPLLKCFDERVLHDLLGEVDVGGPENSREPGDHLSGAGAEQMVDQLLRVGWPGRSRHDHAIRRDRFV
jgi:hypothetical protein